MDVVSLVSMGDGEGGERERESGRRTSIFRINICCCSAVSRNGSLGKLRRFEKLDLFVRKESVTPLQSMLNDKDPICNPAILSAHKWCPFPPNISAPYLKIPFYLSAPTVFLYFSVGISKFHSSKSQFYRSKAFKNRQIREFSTFASILIVLFSTIIRNNLDKPKYLLSISLTHTHTHTPKCVP